MIIADNLKFSCQKCIKGHRTYSCDHLDRQLIEIKAKGRPVSQCGTCRSKRQTQKLKTHHSCKCGDFRDFEAKRKVEFEFENYIRIVVSATISQIQKLHSSFQAKSLTEFAVSKKVKANASKDNSIVETMNLKFLRMTILQELSATDMKLSGEFPIQVLTIENPCKCHIGGTCICSEISWKKKVDSTQDLTSSNGVEQTFPAQMTSVDILIQGLEYHLLQQSIQHQNLLDFSSFGQSLNPLLKIDLSGGCQCASSCNTNAKSSCCSNPVSQFSSHCNVRTSCCAPPPPQSSVACCAVSSPSTASCCSIPSPSAVTCCSVKAENTNSCCNSAPVTKRCCDSISAQASSLNGDSTQNNTSASTRIISSNTNPTQTPTSCSCSSPLPSIQPKSIIESSSQSISLNDLVTTDKPISVNSISKTLDACPCPCQSTSNACGGCKTDLCDQGLLNLFIPFEQ